MRGPTAPAARAYKSPKRLPREHVGEVQRMRIISAMIDVACDQGTEHVAVTSVIGRAGVSRRTFYEHFDGRGDCLLAALRQALALAGGRAGAACDAHERWLDRMRAGLGELLGFFEEEPQLAWLIVVHSAAAGPAATALRTHALEELARAVDEGRAGARVQPPRLTAEGVVGGVLSVIHSRLLRPDPNALIDLLNPLTSMIALPYRGSAAARRELARPTPAPRPPSRPRSSSGPALGRGLRLTYRTLAVLQAIADEPGLSNKQIGDRAGIADQGQISRVLARLCEQGLTKNTGGGQPMGAANEWWLTAHGEQLALAGDRESLARGAERRARGAGG